MAGTVRALFDPGKMTGGNVIRPELISPVDEPAEFKVLVAHHARIRSATGLVLVGEVLNDVLLKFRRLINQVVGNIEFVANRPGIGDRLGTATFVFGAVDAILRPE